MKIIGNIPNNLKIIFSNISKVGGIEVTPAFIADATNNVTVANGIHWANCRPYQKQKQEVQIDETSNTPIEKIRILNLERREACGRAYKVLLPDGYYVDLREDVLLDTIKTVGISPGGVLNGQFVFAIVGSLMKLVRVDSELYKQLTISTQEKSLKKILRKKLQVGHVYESHSGNQSIFLGFVDYIDVEVGKSSTHDHHLVYHNSRSYRYVIKNVHVCKNHTLWMQIRYMRNMTYQQYLDNTLRNNHGFCFLFQKTHSYIHCLGPSEITFDLEQAKKINKYYEEQHIKRSSDKWCDLGFVNFYTVVYAGQDLEIPIELRNYPQIKK